MSNHTQDRTDLINQVDAILIRTISLLTILSSPDVFEEDTTTTLQNNLWTIQTNMEELQRIVAALWDGNPDRTPLAAVESISGRTEVHEA